MKTLIRRSGLPVWIVLAMFVYSTCSIPEEPEFITEEEEEEEETGGPGPITQSDADALLGTLAFTNAARVSGSVPAVANTSLVKTDHGDTIYTMPGIRMPVRISNASGGPVKGWYIAAANSTFYYDVPVDDVEDGDTVSVILIEIDPGDMQLPYDIPVEITPYDEGNQPIDPITRIITIEEPFSMESDITVPGDTSIGSFNFDWYWYWTAVFDPNGEPTFINAPGRVFAATQHPTGCCVDDDLVCPNQVYNENTKQWVWVYDSEVTANTSYSIVSEHLNFWKNGTFTRVTQEKKKNFDPLATDWCNGVPGYIDEWETVFYFGSHDFVPGNNTLSYVSNRNNCDDPLGICGFTTRGGDLKYSSHTMVISIDRLNLEFKKEVRMYTRGSSGWEE